MNFASFGASFQTVRLTGIAVQDVVRGGAVLSRLPNKRSILRLIGAVLMEQNEEWLLQHRYMPQHTMTGELPQDGGTALPISA